MAKAALFSKYPVDWVSPSTVLELNSIASYEGKVVVGDGVSTVTALATASNGGGDSTPEAGDIVFSYVSPEDGAFSSVRKTAISEGLLYVPARTTVGPGITIWSVINPRYPQLVGASPGVAFSKFIDDIPQIGSNYIVIVTDENVTVFSTQWSGYAIGESAAAGFGVSPLLPAVLSTTSLTSPECARHFISSSTNYILIAGNDELNSYSMDPDTGELSLEETPLSGAAFDEANYIVLDLDRSVAVVSADENSYVSTIDITDPTNLSVHDSITDVSLLGVRQLLLVGSYIYALCSGGLVIIDAETLTDISIEGSVTTPILTTPTAMALDEDGVLYVVSSAATSVTAFDLTDPTSPEVLWVKEDELLDGANTIVVQQGYAFITSTERRFIVMKV